MKYLNAWPIIICSVLGGWISYHHEWDNAFVAGYHSGYTAAWVSYGKIMNCAHVKMDTCRDFLKMEPLPVCPGWKPVIKE